MFLVWLAQGVSPETLPWPTLLASGAGLALLTGMAVGWFLGVGSHKKRLLAAEAASQRALAAKASEIQDLKHQAMAPRPDPVDAEKLGQLESEVARLSQELQKAKAATAAQKAARDKAEASVEQFRKDLAELRRGQRSLREELDRATADAKVGG